MAFVEKPAKGSRRAGSWFELDGNTLPSWMAWLPELKENHREVRTLFPSAVDVVEVERYVPPTATRTVRRIAAVGEHVLTGRRQTYYATSVSELRYKSPRGTEIGNFFSIRMLGLNAELTEFTAVALVAVDEERWRVVPVGQHGLPPGFCVVKEGDGYDVKKRP